MSLPPPPGRNDLPPPPDAPREKRPGKGIGALLFFFAVLPALALVGGVAQYVDARLQLPLVALAAVGALLLIRRRLGEQAMFGCLIAFAASVVVAGGACIALLAAFMNEY